VETYTRIYQELENAKTVVVDPVTGRDGMWGVAMVIGDHYFFAPFKEKETWDPLIAAVLKKKVVAFDIRRIIDWPLTVGNPVADVKLLWGGDRGLGKVVRDEFGGAEGPLGRFLELDAKVAAHGRAAKTAKINGMPLTAIIPPQLLADWVKNRTVAISTLYKKATSNVQEVEERWGFILALRQMELSGIKVDLEKVETLLPDAGVAEAGALRSIQGLAKDGFVTSLLNPIGTKTGRLRSEGGFNCLGIPKGRARDVIVSRHEGGLIYTLDFNAIDYRCVVRSIGGDFAKLYEGADDFHERTASFLFKELLRSAVNSSRRSSTPTLTVVPRIRWSRRLA
jgi:hypothetical protein